jgi:hypothetical protein
MSVDAFADMYPSLTPYHYAANNPIYFVDVNGDSIIISHDNEEIEYRSGKLFWRGKDNEYDGKAVRKGGGILGKLSRLFGGKYKGFVGKTYSALNKIEAGGESGTKLIASLVDNSNITTIMDASANPVGSGSGFDAGSGTLYYGPNQQVTTINEFGQFSSTSGYINLAHELGHAWDLYADGTSYGTKTWFRTISGQPVRTTEKVAGYWENLIRRENGLDFRAYYYVARSNAGKLITRGLLPFRR